MDSKNTPYHAIFDARRHSLQRQQGVPKIIPMNDRSNSILLLFLKYRLDR